MLSLRTALFAAVISLFTLPTLAAPISINLLSALDYYNDGVLKLGDGFGGTKPLDLDNDGAHDNDPTTNGYQRLFSGMFTLSQMASDGLFSLIIEANGIDYGPHQITFNNNANIFKLYRSSQPNFPSTLFTSNNQFADFFQLGQNQINFAIAGSGSNLDDFIITRFELVYDALPTSNVNAPAGIALFLAGLCWVMRRRKA